MHLHPGAEKTRGPRACLRVRELSVEDGFSLRPKDSKSENWRWGHLGGTDFGSKKTRIIC